MFKELHPLIQNRALTITVAAIGDGKVRVNVVPQALDSDNKANENIGYSHKDKIAKIPESAIAALTTPLSLVGTPEEIDGELPMALAQFAESHVQLQKTIEDAKEQIAVAVKEIQDREKSKSKSSSASSTKRDEKSEKSAQSNELLPLWVKPPGEVSGIPPSSNAETVSTGAAATPVQQTVDSEQMEVCRLTQLVTLGSIDSEGGRRNL